MSQASKHKADDSIINPSFFTAGKELIILGKSAPSRKPGESALNNPTPFEHMKAAGADLLLINDGIFASRLGLQTAPEMLDDLDLAINAELALPTF